MGQAYRVGIEPKLLGPFTTLGGHQVEAVSTFGLLFSFFDLETYYATDFPEISLFLAFPIYVLHFKFLSSAVLK